MKLKKLLKQIDVRRRLVMGFLGLNPDFKKNLSKLSLMLTQYADEHEMTMNKLAELMVAQSVCDNDMTRNELKQHGVSKRNLLLVARKRIIPSIGCCFAIADYMDASRSEILELAGWMPPMGDERIALEAKMDAKIRELLEDDPDLDLNSGKVYVEMLKLIVCEENE